jgi:hypothetical protein
MDVVAVSLDFAVYQLQLLQINKIMYEKFNRIHVRSKISKPDKTSVKNRSYCKIKQKEHLLA